MHMSQNRVLKHYIMVTIDTIIFEIVGGGGGLKPPGLLTFSNTLDWIGLWFNLWWEHNSKGRKKSKYS